MSPKLLYRITSVLFVLFALGHQIGFRKVDPAWNVGPVVAGMQTVHFQAMGFSRSYWDFFSGFGFFVTIFLLFAAVLCWNWSSQSDDTLRASSLSRWALAIASVGIAIETWLYFFWAPIVFTIVIALLLILAAMPPKSPSGNRE